MSTPNPRAPQPVEVKNPDPLPIVDVSEAPRDVNVVSNQTTTDTDAQSKARVVAASARVDADILRRDDQRRISGMWERTQQIIALSVVEVTLIVATVKSVEAVLTGADSKEAGVAFVFLASVANLVIGFYFGRTNHQRIGGSTTPEDEGSGGR